MSDDAGREMGLFGATGVGVGAIVGGGVLALTGAAFAVTGPSAIIAFGLNGVIALLTALSFAEVSSKFPESGGTYTFAKKVLSVEAAFTVGWVVWFASIVAAVLYALGFGQFAVASIAELWPDAGGGPPAWLSSRASVCVLATIATVGYAIMLSRKAAGGGQWANIGKVTVFAVLIAAGIWALRDRPPAELGRQLTPFFAQGATGLFQAMGFTFIALQGFDLIAAVAGEIRDPQRLIPRAMLYSLGIALTIYLPLLFVVSTVGMPAGRSIVDASRQDPETIVAIAAGNYLGRFGFWLVLVAGILSMLSALNANLFAASRMAQSMARDRTLPRFLARVRPKQRTPAIAVWVTAAIVIAVLLFVPNVAAAGAAASLVFLISFALVHWITVLVRQRSVRRPPPFCVPLFPLVPVVGGLACAVLAGYEGWAVPSAGIIVAVWLSFGGILFLGLFAHRARVADASSEALDPELVRLRGHSPLVLVPIANPDNARSLADVANALAPPEVGRVLMLSVVVAPPDWRPLDDPRPLENIQSILRDAIAASADVGSFPEALATVASQPWQEISRVARAHRCESLLLGFSGSSATDLGSPLERVMSDVDCDIVVVRADKDWRLSHVRRVLVPTGGRGGHDRLLARLLASLSRREQIEVTFLKVEPTRATPRDVRQSERHLRRLSADLCRDTPLVRVVTSDTPIDTIIQHAESSDLVVLGIHRVSRREKLFGHFSLQIARQTSKPILLICRRG